MIEQPRTVMQGSHGSDVIGYKGGLVNAGVRPHGLARSPLFGRRMRDEVAAFQHRAGLQVNGILGPHTYAKLYPHLGAYARHLISITDTRLQMATLRARFVQNMLWSCQPWLYPYWIYDEVRPIPVNHPFRVVSGAHPVVTDCSGFIVMMAKWSDAPSPVPSFGYTGGGSSYTMLDELEHVGFPEMGDLIIYDNPGHVVGCIGYPYAVSFGAEPGPVKLDSRYRPATGYRRFLP